MNAKDKVPLSVGFRSSLKLKLSSKTKNQEKVFTIVFEEPVLELV